MPIPNVIKGQDNVLKVLVNCERVADPTWYKSLGCKIFAAKKVGRLCPPTVELFVVWLSDEGRDLDDEATRHGTRAVSDGHETTHC